MSQIMIKIIIRCCLYTLSWCFHVNRFIYLLNMCQMCQMADIESCLTTISSSSSSPLTPTSVFCDPFIISHLTVWQNGSAAVKHLQGHSTGRASTFCLAISWCVNGMREIGWESIWQHHSQETERGGVCGGGGVRGPSVPVRIAPQGFAVRAVKFAVGGNWCGCE